MNKIIILLFLMFSFSIGFAQKPLVSDGEYFIQVSSTKKYIAIENISQSNGASLVQWDFANNPNHKFIVKHLGKEVYSFKAVHSGKYLSLDSKNADYGSKIIQQDWQNQENQKWFIRPSTQIGGAFTISSIVNNMRMRLTGEYSNPRNGAWFILQNSEPVNNFLFKKNEVEQPQAAPSQLLINRNNKAQVNIQTQQNTSTILAAMQDGVYKIRINESGKYLAIAGQEDISNGMRLIQWDMMPRNNHLFRVTKLSNGNYSIAAVHSNKVLDVVDRRTDDNAPIQQWDNLNGSNQQWKFFAETNGSVNIANAQTGKKLQLINKLNDQTNGTALVVKTDGKQTYTFLPAKELAYTETITIKGLRLAIPKGDDANIFGSILIFLYDKRGIVLKKCYATPAILMDMYEYQNVDMNTNRVLDISNSVVLKIPSTEMEGAKIVVNYGVKENDADVKFVTTFGADQGPIPDDRKYASTGSDDFYVINSVKENCISGVYKQYDFRYSTMVQELPESCMLHTRLQDEDKSENYVDIYFTITRQRGN